VRKTVSTSGITDMTWHHVACVYDAAQAKNFIYLDGGLAGSSSVSGTPYVGSEPLRAGVCNAGDRFKGDVDLLRISSGIRYASAPFSPPTYYRGSKRRRIVQLSWSQPATGIAISYRVYRRPVGAGTKVSLIASLPALEYRDAGAAEGAYIYTVSGINSMDIEGNPSEPVTADLRTTDAPDAADGAGRTLSVWPNPFNPQATVTFRLQRRGPVLLEMFDARGRRVDTLVRGTLPAGSHRVDLARGGREIPLASGIYFLHLRADGRDTRLKAVLVR
jgi:hypothetical protein